MSLTIVTSADKETGIVLGHTRTVSCDAPGCTTSASLPESGALPAGWHTLEMAAQPGVDAPRWHFHEPACVAAFLALVRGVDGDVFAKRLAAYTKIMGGIATSTTITPGETTDSIAAITTKPAEPAVADEPAMHHIFGLTQPVGEYNAAPGYEAEAAATLASAPAVAAEPAPEPAVEAPVAEVAAEPESPAAPEAETQQAPVESEPSA